MSTISKVFTVVNLVLAMFVLGSVAAILAYSEDYKADFESEQEAHAVTRQELADAQSELSAQVSTLDDQIRRLTNKNDDLEAQNQTLTAERNQVRQDNNQLRNDVSGINSSLQTLQSQLADLESRNKELMDKNAEYRQTAADAEAAKMAAEEDRARLEGALAARDADIAELERRMTAVLDERDTLRAEQEALAQAGVAIRDIIGNTLPLIEGTVSDVGAGFVVLSVGEDDGVQIGYSFDVYRGKEYIGRVVVDKVFPDNAIARVRAKQEGRNFQALDNATTRL